MEIAKVEINNEWQKVDALIQAQDGHSGFAFDSNTTYQLQAEGNHGVRLCVAASTPGEKDGVVIEGTQPAHFKLEEGKFLFAKSVGGLTSALPLLDVSTIGE